MTPPQMPNKTEGSEDEPSKSWHFWGSVCFIISVLAISVVVILLSLSEAKQQVEATTFQTMNNITHACYLRDLAHDNLAPTGSDEKKFVYDFLKHKLAELVPRYPMWESGMLLARDETGDFYVKLEVTGANAIYEPRPYSTPIGVGCQALRAAYSAQKATTSFADHDQFGWWVTFYLPWVSPKTSQVELIFCVRMALGPYLKLLASLMWIPLLLVSLVLLAGAGVFVVTRRRTRVRNFESVLTLILGIIFSLMVTWYIDQLCQHKRVESFTRIAQEKTTTLFSWITNIRNFYVPFLRHMLFYGEENTIPEIREHMETAFTFPPGTIVCAFAPHILHADRGAFERTKLYPRKQEINTIQAITETNLVSSLDRPFYFPFITLPNGPFASHQTLRHLFGVDLLQTPYATCVQRVLAEHRPYGCRMINEDIAAGPQKLIFIPIDNNLKDIEVSGVAVLLVNFKKLLSALDIVGDKIAHVANITLVHKSDDTGALTLVTSLDPFEFNESADLFRSDYRKIQLTTPMIIYGETFFLTITPDATFFAKTPLWEPWVALLACVSFVVILTFLIHALNKSKEALQKHVVSTTDSLAHSMVQTDLLIHAGRILLWEADLKGNFTDVIGDCEGFLGYTNTEIIGLNVDTITPPEELESRKSYREASRMKRTEFSISMYKLIRKDKSAHWVNVYCDQIIDAQTNTCIGFRGCYVDAEALHELKDTVETYKHRVEAMTTRTQAIFWRMDAETLTYTYISKGYFSKTGIDPTTMVGKALHSILNAQSGGLQFIETTRMVLEWFHQGIAPTDNTYAIPFYYTHADGHNIPFEISYGFAINPQTKRLEIHGVSWDISHHAQEEHQLLNQQHDLETLLNNIPGTVYRVNTNRVLEYVTEDCYETLGYHADELLFNAHNWIDVIAPEERATYLTRIQQQLDYGNRAIVEVQFRTRTGEKHWMRNSISAVRDAEGSIRYYVGFITAISPYKNIEMQNNRLINAVYYLSEAIAICDLEGRVLFANAALAEITGRPLKTLLHRPIYTIYGQAVGKRFFSRVCSIINNSHHFWHGQINSTRPDGTTYTEDLKVAIFKDAKFNCSYLTSIHRDITSEVVVTKEKNDFQQKLAQSQKLESMGRITGGLAHDFNNMLQAIIGYAELALTGISQDMTAHEDVTSVIASAREAVSLTRQLLFFSRDHILKPETIEINQAIAEAADSIRRLVHKGHTLNFRYGPNAMVTLDQGGLSEILRNLVTNADEALGDKEGGEINIETSLYKLKKPVFTYQRTLAPGSYLCIKISDNGCGISPEDLNEIFEPFFSTKYKSAGLGLPTAHGIIKRAHGGILIASEVDVGSAFSILLPWQPADETTTNKPQPKVLPTNPSVSVAAKSPSTPTTTEASISTSAPQEPTVPKNGKTLLVVDDEAGILHATCRILGALGYETISANSPEEAINIFTEKKDMISLLLTDVMMPKMNGLQLFKHLRTIKPELRVLMMSGYTADVFQDEVPIDKDSLLLKPFSRDQLANALDSAFQQSSEPTDTHPSA